MDSVGEGEGGEIWENSIETCIISCMKRVASQVSMHGTGCLGSVAGSRQLAKGLFEPQEEACVGEVRMLGVPPV